VGAQHLGNSTIGFADNHLRAVHLWNT
jgi:hypothetical protein